MQAQERDLVGADPARRPALRALSNAFLGAAALLALTGCGRNEPQRTTQVIVQPPTQQVQSPSVVAPGPPPPAQTETVPPPSGTGPVVWQPGHWRFSGNQWFWQPGQYVPPPTGQATWIPGRWVQQPAGGWVWQDGHWA
jgi:hypothetical protein